MSEKIISIRLYSTEKQKTTGNGQFSIKCKESEVERMRTDQKNKNQQYKEACAREKKNGNSLHSTYRDEPLPPLQSKDYRVQSAKDILPTQTEFELVLDEGTGNTTFILGSSKMGKSTLLMHIFDDYYSDRDNIVTLFSINSHIKLYGKRERLLRFPSNYKDSPAYITKYVNTEKRINSKTKNLYSFVNMYDDMIDSRYSKSLLNSIITYRNSNLSTVICLQYSNLLAKSCRSNVNNVIMFGLNTDEAIKQAVDCYLKSTFKQMGIPVSDHIEFYKKLTSNHQFIYYRPATGDVSFHKLKL